MNNMIYIAEIGMIIDGVYMKTAMCVLICSWINFLRQKPACCAITSYTPSITTYTRTGIMLQKLCCKTVSLEWRHNGHDCVSNHQPPHDCLLNRLFRRRLMKASKPQVTGLFEGNTPVTGEISAQRISNLENVSIWWRFHDNSRNELPYNWWKHVSTKAVPWLRNPVSIICMYLCEPP